MNALGIVLAAFWLGALVAIDLVETPTKFRVLNRNEAVKLGREVFRLMSRMEILLGLLFMLAAWQGGGPEAVSLAVALWLAVLLTAFPLRRSLDRSMKDLDLVDRDPARQPEYRALQKRHVLFVVADGCKLLLLLAYLVLETFQR